MTLMRNGRSMVLMLGASAVMAIVPASAAAQCRLCSTPTTSPQQGPVVGDDVRLEIETDLDFDRLIVAAGTGDATLRPDGSSLATGSIEMGPRARVATVIVHGDANRILRIDVPRRIDLFSLGGGSLTFDQVETDAPEIPRLDAAGNLTFHIGGRLRFTGSEDGAFRGDLPITVEYQ
jgi:Domain of unknown function (DUF4402)